MLDQRVFVSHLLYTNLQNALLTGRPAYNYCTIVNSTVPGIYFTHPTIWLTAAEICKKTQVFPKLNMLTNHGRKVLDMQIRMPCLDKLRTASACRKRH